MVPEKTGEVRIGDTMFRKSRLSPFFVTGLNKRETCLFSCPHCRRSRNMREAVVRTVVR